MEGCASPHPQEEGNPGRQQCNNIEPYISKEGSHQLGKLSRSAASVLKRLYFVVLIALEKTVEARVVDSTSSSLAHCTCTDCSPWAL